MSPVSGPIPNCPTLAGFTNFVYTVMGVPEKYLPTEGDYAPAAQLAIAWAYEAALLIVNQQFNCISPPVYTMMVFNLAGNNLINWAPDVASNPPTFYRTAEECGGSVGIGYFAFLRQDMDLNGFVPGVISASYDQGTGESLVVPDALKGLTIADLQTLKTPWGRTYMGFAQQFGDAWGLTI